MTEAQMARRRPAAGLRRELGLREMSADPRALAIILAGVGGLLVAQSLLSYTLTGYPAFVLRPISTLGGTLFVVVLPIILLLGALGALRLPRRFLWLTGFPMLLVAIGLQLAATIGTSDHTSGGLFVLLVIQFFAGYQLRPIGAWVGCVLVTIALALNAALLLGASEAIRILVVGAIVTGTATWMLIRARDAQEQLAGRYRAEARHDSLTGVRSRLAMTEWADVMLPLAGPGTGLILVDLDHFKRLNDRYGHPTGDAMLRRVADHLLAVARDKDLVARLGGDEFGLLLSAVRVDEVTARAQSLAGRLAADHLPLEDGTELPVRVSVGTAHLAPGHYSADDLIAAADVEMYAAKQRRPDGG